MALVVKNPSANAGDVRVQGLIPGLGRSPGVGNGNWLQYSCLENSMDKGAWWATVHGAAKHQTRRSTHRYTHRVLASYEAARKCTFYTYTHPHTDLKSQNNRQITAMMPQ